MSNSWVKRRWFDFRLGHTVYLAFTLAFGNFIMIAYGLYIERLNIELELWQFAVLLIAVYIPTAVFIGVWHRKRQLSVEAEQLLRNNPMMAKNFRILLDAIRNQNEDEIDKYRELLKKIEGNT